MRALQITKSKGESSAPHSHLLAGLTNVSDQQKAMSLICSALGSNLASDARGRGFSACTPRPTAQRGCMDRGTVFTMPRCKLPLRGPRYSLSHKSRHLLVPCAQRRPASRGAQTLQRRTRFAGTLSRICREHTLHPPTNSVRHAGYRGSARLPWICQ